MYKSVRRFLLLALFSGFLSVANAQIPDGAAGWTENVNILSVRPDGAGSTPDTALYRIYTSGDFQNPADCTYEVYTFKADAQNYSQSTAIALAALISGNPVQLFLDGRTAEQGCQSSGHVKVAHIRIFAK